MDAQFSRAQCPGKFVTASLQLVFANTKPWIILTPQGSTNAPYNDYYNASFSRHETLKHHMDGGRCPEPLPEAPPIALASACHHLQTIPDFMEDPSII